MTAGRNENDKQFSLNLLPASSHRALTEISFCLIRQEKEREEVQKRQKNEINEFRKRLEQKRNDKQSKEGKRSVTSNTSSVPLKITTIIAQTQTVSEQHRSANGHTVKSTVKKQIHSDENLKKFQERSMQQFAYDASKKKGGGVRTR